MRLGEQLDLLTHDRMAQEKTDRKHRASNEPHPDPDLTQWQALNNRLVALVKPLFALTARTPAGLAIQTKAATMACQDLWDIKAETEAPPLDVERVFIEAVCRYSGIAVPAKR